MNIFKTKGIGVAFTVKVTRKPKFVEGKPELSQKGIYSLTVKGGTKTYTTTCTGSGELFAKAWALLAAHFPKAYEKATAIAKAQRTENRAKAKAVRKAKKAAAAPSDVKSLLTLLNRQGKGKGKGNGKIVALFL